MFAFSGSLWVIVSGYSSLWSQKLDMKRDDSLEFDIAQNKNGIREGAVEKDRLAHRSEAFTSPALNRNLVCKPIWVIQGEASV